MTAKNMRLDWDPDTGLNSKRPTRIGDKIICLTAPNPGPFTFHGTNTYVIGTTNLTVVDPGPEDDAHFESLLGVIGGRTVSHILITHTHRDHSPLARRLAAHTGAMWLGEGPRRYTSGQNVGEGNALNASADLDFMPDHKLIHDELINCGENSNTCSRNARPCRKPHGVCDGERGCPFLGRSCVGLGNHNRGAA